MDTASETVPKTPNFPTKFAKANSDSEQHETVGIVPRSLQIFDVEAMI